MDHKRLWTGSGSQGWEESVEQWEGQGLVIHEELGWGLRRATSERRKVYSSSFGQQIRMFISRKVAVAFTPDDEVFGSSLQVEKAIIDDAENIMVYEWEWGAAGRFGVCRGEWEGSQVSDEGLVVSEDDTVWGRKAQRTEEVQADCNSGEFTPSSWLSAGYLEEEITVVRSVGTTVGHSTSSVGALFGAIGVEDVGCVENVSGQCGIVKTKFAQCIRTRRQQRWRRVCQSEGRDKWEGDEGMGRAQGGDDGRQGCGIVEGQSRWEGGVNRDRGVVTENSRKVAKCVRQVFGQICNITGAGGDVVEEFDGVCIANPGRPTGVMPQVPVRESRFNTVQGEATCETGTIDNVHWKVAGGVMSMFHVAEDDGVKWVNRGSWKETELEAVNEERNDGEADQFDAV
jgi:hypothetical protein